MSEIHSIYESLGEEKIKALVKHFYQEVSKTTDLLQLYETEDLSGAEERLFLFLIYVFGGPPTYLEKRGNPMLRRRHFQWPIDSKMRNLWMNCMLKAIDHITMDNSVKDALLDYFVKAANHMVNKQ